MPIEIILVRVLIVLALLFLIITLTFYPLKYAALPLVFLAFFSAAHLILSKEAKVEMKGSRKHGFNVTIIFLAITVIGAFISLALLWQRGNFWRLS